jgi:uncharacterized membrane protein YozB (DUF420 family)
MPAGILGTRADLLVDVGVLSIVAVVPILLYSWRLARHKRWSLHKRVQVVTFVVLALVVGLFEWDIRQAGGIFVMTAASRYAGTATLDFWIWCHTGFAISSSLLWLGLVIVSLIKFPVPPIPVAFRSHRYWGRLGMLLMLGSGLTAIPMYIYGFVY